MKKILAPYLLLLAVSFTAVANGQTSEKKTDPTPDTAVLEVRLSGAELYRSMVSDATKEIEAKLSDRDSRRWRNFLIAISSAVAILGFLGFKSLKDLREKIRIEIITDLNQGNLLPRLVDTSVRSNLTETVERRIGAVSEEVAFNRLYALADRLKAGSSFSNAERDSALLALERLIDNEDISSRPDFEAALEKIIDSFAGANLEAQIDQISLKMEKVTLHSTGIIHTMIQHYGYRTVGAVSEVEAPTELFYKYAKACKQNRLYELAIPFLLVLAYKGGNSAGSIPALIQDLSHLSQEDKERAFKLFQSRINQKDSPTGEIERTNIQFRRFWEEYGSEIIKLVQSGPRD